MLSALWGRITGADKKKALPDQQASVLGRLGDYIVVYPYGSYCDLPDNVWLRVIDKGVVVPVTSDRPDTERGEPVFFHPVTGAKIHFKNNGDIDVETDANVNVSCANANITASEDISAAVGGNLNATVTGDIVASCANLNATATTKVTVTAPDTEFNGNVKINGNLEVTGTIKGAGVTDTITNVTLNSHLTPALGVPPTPGT